MSEISFTGGGRFLARYRSIVDYKANFWQMRVLSVCSSTELLLNNWLVEQPRLTFPRAVVSERQIAGRGQKGRFWYAPKGGVWVSVALPWNEEDSCSPGMLGLQVASLLAERLELRHLPVKIKWPNDLLLGGRKVAGILPGLVQRGSRIRFVRIGLGLNVYNRVHSYGVSLRDFSGTVPTNLELWTAELLQIFDHCHAGAIDSTTIVKKVNRRLWADQVKDPSDGSLWNIDGVAVDGSLCLRREARKVQWFRWP